MPDTIRNLGENRGSGFNASAPTPTRAFFWLWLGQTVSLLGSQLSGFALGVTVFARTGSAFLYGLVLFVTITPQVLIAPFAGVVVDRIDRRMVLLFEQV